MVCLMPASNSAMLSGMLNPPHINVTSFTFGQALITEPALLCTVRVWMLGRLISVKARLIPAGCLPLRQYTISSVCRFGRAHRQIVKAARPASMYAAWNSSETENTLGIDAGVKHA